MKAVFGYCHSGEILILRITLDGLRINRAWPERWPIAKSIFLKGGYV